MQLAEFNACYRPHGDIPSRATLKAEGEGSYFSDIICNRQQAGGAFEKLALKISAQAIAHHRNIGIICDTGQLPDLRRR